MNRVDTAINAADLSLSELVQDPLIGLVMKSDGVDRRHIEALFERICDGRPSIAAQNRRVSERPRGPARRPR